MSVILSSFKRLVVISLCLTSLEAHSEIDTLIAPYLDQVLWYTFESDEDTVYDQSGNNLDGMMVGNVYKENGKLICPGGMSEYLHVNSDPRLMGIGEYTVALHIRLEDDNRDRNMQFIGNGYDGYKVIYHPRLDSVYYYKNDRPETGISLNIDTIFHEIVVVFKDTLMSVYFDGETEQDSIKISSIEESLYEVRMAYRWEGEVEEIKIFNTALDSNRIKNVFTVDTIAPAIPSGLEAVIATTDTVMLEWDKSADSLEVAGYAVYRDSVFIGATESPMFYDIGADPHILHTYNIRAFDYSGNLGGYSSAIAVDLCESIVMEYSQNVYEVACANVDDIIIKTIILDFGYSYRWQAKEEGAWVDLTDNDYYKHTDSSELFINGIYFSHSQPSMYRLAIQNNCRTEYFDSVVVVPEEVYSISGSVIVGKNNLDSGIVYLYKNGGTYTLIDSVSVINGDYLFEGLCAGEYKLKAKPMGSSAEMYSEGFYMSASNINSAISLNIDADFSHVIISLKPKALSMEDISGLEIAIYPSVADSEINIVSSDVFSSDTEVRITDLRGSLVLSQIISAGEKRASIRTINLGTGTYFVTLVTDKGIVSNNKIVIIGSMR